MGKKCLHCKTVNPSSRTHCMKCKRELDDDDTVTSVGDAGGGDGFFSKLLGGDTDDADADGGDGGGGE